MQPINNPQLAASWGLVAAQQLAESIALQGATLRAGAGNQLPGAQLTPINPAGLSGAAPAFDALPAVRLAGPPPPSGRRFLFPPQGGVAVRTSEGMIQLGVPMWLNKWVNGRYQKAGGRELPPEQVRHEIPLHFIHDADFAGLDVGFLPHDFLGYMGFIVPDTVFTMVAPDPDQAARLKRFLDLSYLGDRSADLNDRIAREYLPTALAIPDLLAEMTRGFDTRDPETLRRVTAFDEVERYTIGQVVVERLGNQRYRITDRGEVLGIADLKRHPIPSPRRQRISAASNTKLMEVRQRAVTEGRAGLWPIGTSDGFDPKGSTSGFMIWNKGRYLLVDPPSRTFNYLEEIEIPLDLLEGVILTHGHTDHFGDAVPRLLRRKPGISLYTTPTIHAMLSEQYQLALGSPGLERWDFRPVRPGLPAEILGLEFVFDYTFHTVPTIGFDLWDNNNLLLHFSGDTLASEEKVIAVAEAEPPVMNPFRVFSVLRHLFYLPLSSLVPRPPIILIDGGIPPIHTPPEETHQVIEETKAGGDEMSHVLVYHISDRRARKLGVPRWQEGHHGWIELPTP